MYESQTKFGTMLFITTAAASL